MPNTGSVAAPLGLFDAGADPRAGYFLLLRQKKVTKEKAAPVSRRYAIPCASRTRRVRQTGRPCPDWRMRAIPGAHPKGASPLRAVSASYCDARRATGDSGVALAASIMDRNQGVPVTAPSGCNFRSEWRSAGDKTYSGNKRYSIHTRCRCVSCCVVAEI